MIIKEVEYNLEGKKIFEGEYQNNEKYKGKEYNDFGELEFEGKYFISIFIIFFSLSISFTV